MSDVVDSTLFSYFSQDSINVELLPKTSFTDTIKSLPIFSTFHVIPPLFAWACSFPLFFAVFRYLALNIDGNGDDDDDYFGEELDTEEYLRFTRELSKEREFLFRQRNEDLLEKERQEEQRILDNLLRNVRTHREDDERSRRFEEWLQMPD